MSGYLGSIGFALPAAIGAWAATKEDGSLFHGRPVISISGDGGFGQYMAELTTAVKYDMNITHVLLNNNELSSTRTSLNMRSSAAPRAFGSKAPTCSIKRSKTRSRMRAPRSWRS